MDRFLLWGYTAISLGTALFLTFADGYDYNGWNRIVALPINLFLGAIWPLYWGILHWL